ncbi:HNH endonuclease signature motif containing protein [Massilia sp. CCM 8734]|uniref:HNH endonuclease signature motif containing protein n=1 Tax=Massilia sp. CCM 8734 TaxID=2609283 RepID=UPI00141F158F|nr:HNH endonuclease signature motif containing protein [Massilia sp. CCM 8734]NIA00797.1 HNH endonuclease [Massilia sp. CCM 8734]
MAKKSLSPERLREVLHYNEMTGVFTRLKSGSGRTPSGPGAGGDNGAGYTVIVVDRCQYRAHRLAFLYMLGRWPSAEVDHINGYRSDNAWTNLREVTCAENTQNQRRPHRNNKVGLLGVKRSGKRFTSTIGLGGTQKHIGTFDTAAEAHQAYLLHKRSIHKTATI